VCAFVLNLAAPAFGKDKIDVQLDACLSTGDGQTTDGAIECIGKAEAAWEAKLNAAYESLMKTLDPKSQALLRTAQTSWLDYRKKDADFAFDGPWRANSGSLDAELIASSRLDELRARVQALETYAEGD